MARKSRKPQASAIQRIIEKKTAIYVRLSREDRENRGDSLENQKLIATEHLLGIAELGTGEVYEDNGYTGRNSDRPAFQKLLKDIENGEIEAVIVKDLSRMSRNSLESGFYIEKFFPQHGVRFISVTDGYDSALDKDGTETAIIPIKNMLNEAYSLDLGKKIKSAKQKSIRDGEFVGTRAPFGYRKKKENHFQLEIDPVSSQIVLEIYDRFLKGEKMGAIAKKFNDRGELSPLDYDDSVKGKEIKPEKARVWRNHSIEKILTSEYYLGHMVQGTTENRSGTTKKSDPSQWIKVENTHEALISPEMFSKTQEMVKQSRMKTKAIQRKPNIYVGKLFCGHCGKPLTRDNHPQKAKGDVFRYTCKSNYIVRKDYCSHGFQCKIWEEHLNELVGGAINQVVIAHYGKRLEILVNEWKLDNHKKEQENKLKMLNANISKQQTHLKSLYENLVNSVITTQDYLELKESYEKGIQENKKEYQELSAKIKVLEDEIAYFMSLPPEIVPILELDRSVIEAFVNHILVFSEELLELQFNFSSDSVDEVLEREA